MNITNTFLCESIDDYLGDGEFRFFGMGYRRVNYDINNIVINSADEKELKALITVDYPVDWSKKKSNALPPHLSSVDMIILSVQLCEMFMRHALNLTNEQYKAIWLRNIKLKAGTKAQEDLKNINISLKWKSTAKNKLNDNYISTFYCSIGEMQSRFDVEHPQSEWKHGVANYHSPNDLLGDLNARYYGESFKFRGQKLTNIHYDRENNTASADISVHLNEGYSSTEGIEQQYQSSITFVDSFVSNLQLAQILMYELDGITRKDSETLWMLKTEINAESPVRENNSHNLLKTTITSSSTLDVEGDIWRLVDIQGSLSGIALKCSLGHKLPK